MKTELDPKTLSVQALKELAEHPGPCLSLLAPPYHPGAGGESREAVLKALVWDASVQAKRSANADIANDLVHAAEAAIRNLDVRRGGSGLCIFLAPGFEASYSARVYEAQASLGSYCLMRPLLVDVLANHDLFVLTLNTKRLRLFEYRNSICRQIPLPENVPESLDASRSVHGEPHLSNRKAAGAFAHGSSVHFGATHEHDRRPSNLENFFERVDRGLQKIQAWRPLLLLGVHEELVAYQRVAANVSSLLPVRAGNADSLSLAQIERLAREAEIDDFYKRSQNALKDFAQKTNRGQTASEVFEILSAAADGRVHELCVRAATPIFGKLPAALDRAFVPSEDLVNAAVAETLRTGGEVFVAPQDKMSDKQPLAAILRY